MILSTLTIMNSSSFSETALDEAHSKILHEYTPIIALMSICACIGICANIVTIIFYSQRASKSSTIRFITALACIDLVASVLIISTIIDMCVNIYFTNAVLCKLMYFLDQWSIVTSVFILATIAIDRHLKICRPLGKQLTIQKASQVICVAIGVGFVLAIRNFVTYDIVPVNVTVSGGTASGFYCTGTDDPSLATVVTVFHVVDIIMISSILILFIYIYGQIGYVLYKHTSKLNVILNGSRRALGGYQSFRESTQTSVRPTSSELRPVRTRRNSYTLEPTQGTNFLEYMYGIRPSGCNSAPVSIINNNNDLEMSVRKEAGKRGSPLIITTEPCGMSNRNDKRRHGIILPDMQAPHLYVRRHSYGMYDFQNGTNTLIGINQSAHKHKHRRSSLMDNFQFHSIESIAHGSDSDTTETSVGSSKPINPTRRKSTGANSPTLSVIRPTLQRALSNPSAKLSVLSNMTSGARDRRMDAIRQSERNVTVMMVSVSVALVCCFTPFFIVSLGMRTIASPDDEFDALTQLAIRSPFFNSVINPFLFCIFNPRYRRYIIQKLAWFN